jgi:hypothetical protein
MRRISPVFVKQKCHLDRGESTGFPAPGSLVLLGIQLASLTFTGTAMILPCGCTLRQKIARGSPARAPDGFSLQLTGERWIGARTRAVGVEHVPRLRVSGVPGK